MLPVKAPHATPTAPAQIPGRAVSPGPAVAQRQLLALLERPSTPTRSKIKSHLQQIPGVFIPISEILQHCLERYGLDPWAIECTLIFRKGTIAYKGDDVADLCRRGHRKDVSCGHFETRSHATEPPRTTHSTLIDREYQNVLPRTKPHPRFCRRVLVTITHVDRLGQVHRDEAAVAVRPGVPI